MALKLGNFQSPKKASNPSIQIPDEAPVKMMALFGNNWHFVLLLSIFYRGNSNIKSLLAHTLATQFDAKDPKAQCRVQKCIR